MHAILCFLIKSLYMSFLLSKSTKRYIMKIVIASSIILAFAGVCSARAPSLRRSDPDKRDGERMDLLIREIAESGRRKPTPPDATFCGCDTCTQEVWDSETGWGHHTCGRMITALQTRWSFEEARACKYMGREYPDSPCGQFCDPSTCNQNVGEVA